MPEHMHIFERPTPEDELLGDLWRCIFCADEEWMQDA